MFETYLIVLLASVLILHTLRAGILPPPPAELSEAELKRFAHVEEALERKIRKNLEKEDSCKKKERLSILRKKIKQRKKTRREQLKAQWRRQKNQEKKEAEKRKIMQAIAAKEEERKKKEADEVIAVLAGDKGKGKTIVSPAEKKAKKAAPWLRDLFRGPIEIEVAPRESQHEFIEQLDHQLASVQKDEESRHKLEIARGQREAKKEQEYLRKELQKIADYAIKQPMPKQKKREIAKQLHDLQEKKEPVSGDAQKEINEAIARIKSDRLVFKPQDIILEKENLGPMLEQDVEKVLDIIAQAREEMLNLHLEKVKGLYLTARALYLNLPANEQKRVYSELAELFSERKKVEGLFAS